MKKQVALFLSFSAFGCNQENQRPSELNLASYGKWPDGTRTYCIDDNFGHHKGVIESLVDRTLNDWLTYADLSFQKVDCSDSANVKVTMRNDISPRGQAFFPVTSHGEIKIKLVDGRGQLLDKGQVKAERAHGIILHEWGHVLGFVHEHSRRQNPITGKDSRSIMYYPSASGATHKSSWDIGWDNRRLSLLDKVGATKYYPSTKFGETINASPEVFSETSSSSCPAGHVLKGIGCYGKSCDDKRLFCAKINFEMNGGLVEGAPISRGQFTENLQGFISKLHCSGHRCSTISATYETSPDIVQTDCKWNEAFSEEGGWDNTQYHFMSPRNRAITGIACYGKECDSLRVRTCSYTGVDVKESKNPLPSKNPCVSVFEHDDYRGKIWQLLCKPSYDKSWNDKISSMIVPENYSLTVCEHSENDSRGFGSCTDFSGKINTLGNWNDKISYVKLKPLL